MDNYTLESVRQSIRGESVSYGEIIWLQEHRGEIAPDDYELLQWVDSE